MEQEDENNQGVTQEVVEQPSGRGNLAPTDIAGRAALDEQRDVELEKKGVSTISQEALQGQDVRDDGIIAATKQEGHGGTFGKEFADEQEAKRKRVKHIETISGGKSLIKPPEFIKPPEEPKIIDTISSEKALVPPPQRGVDFTEQEKLLEQEKLRQEGEIKAKEAVNIQNTKNAFSHLLSKGQDSGFINANNMNAIRAAGRRSDDSLFKINTEFNKNMLDISKSKAKQDADFNEEAYQGWVTSGNDQITQLISSGDFGEAANVARMYGEVDDNPMWAKFNNPDYMEALEASFDVENSNTFKSIREQIGSIAINSSLEGLNFKQSKDEILTLLDSNLLGKKEMIDTLSLIDESEYAILGVPEEHRDALNKFRDGSLDVDDQRVRDAFADVYIRDLQNDKIAEELASRTSELSQIMQDSPLGASLYHAIINDEAGPISWDGSGGLDVGEFSIFGRDVDILNDPDQIRFTPGLDVFFEDSHGVPYTDEYTMETARSGPVKGLKEGEFLPENEGFYVDAYQDYIKVKTAAYNILGTEEKAGFEVKNYQEYLNEVRNNDSLKGSGVVGNDINSFIGSEETGGIKHGLIGDIALSDLDVQPSRLVDMKDEYLRILGGEESIHDVIDNIGAMKKLLAEGSTTGDIETSALTQDLINNGIVSSVDGFLGTPMLGRDNFITDPNHALNGASGEDILRSLDDNGKGYIAIDGEMYKVSTSGTRGKTRGGSKSWNPMIQWSLEPVAGGDTITARTSFSNQTKLGTDHKAGWATQNGGTATGIANDAYNFVLGGE